MTNFEKSRILLFVVKLVRWSSWFRTHPCHGWDHEFESRTHRKWLGSSVGRATDWSSVCRRFDSVPRHLWGSSEVWLNATVCKTVPSGSVVRIHSPPFYRDIVKRYNYGLQNRHCGFDSYYPCSTEYFGGIGEVWLTHRFVGPTCVGSNPTYRPFD